MKPLGSLAFGLSLALALLPALPAAAATLIGQPVSGERIALRAVDPIEIPLAPATAVPATGVVDFTHSILPAFNVGMSFAFEADSLTIACTADAAVTTSFFDPAGFDVAGFRFTFTDPGFIGLQSATLSGQNAGVVGTPGALLDGPNTLLIDPGNVGFLNFASGSFPLLDEPASATCAFTFADDTPVIPLPAPFRAFADCAGRAGRRGAASGGLTAPRTGARPDPELGPARHHEARGLLQRVGPVAI